MRLSAYFLPTLRENPAEAQIASHRLMLRAGLVRQFAARHGLGQLDPRIAYLTGDAPVPGVRSFRGVEHGRYNEKTLRATLRERQIGAVEILVRGLTVRPDELRPRLRLRGPGAATVVLTRIGDVPTCFVCEPSVTVGE